MSYFEYNSRKIHYLSKGHGELLIILPGNTAAAIAHKPQIDYFSEFFFTVSLDYSGTGKSERINSWPENWWEYSARQVNALITHLQYKNSIVIGTSGGAIAAIYLAHNYPEKVKALVLDSFSTKFTVEMYRKNAIEQRENPGLMQKQFWQYCHGDDYESIIQKDTQLLKLLMNRGGDWLAAVHETIKCPALLTGSKSDGFIPNIEKEYDKTAKRIPDCEIKLSTKGNHPLIWTNPDFFYKASMHFLKKIK